MSPAASLWMSDYLRRWRWPFVTFAALHAAAVAASVAAGLPFVVLMFGAMTGMVFFGIDMMRGQVRALLGAPVTAKDLSLPFWLAAFVLPSGICITATAAGLGLARALGPMRIEVAGLAAAVLWSCGLLGLNTLCFTQLPCRPPQTRRERLKAMAFSAPWGIQNSFAFIVPLTGAWRGWLAAGGALGLLAGGAALWVFPSMVLDRARPSSLSGAEKPRNPGKRSPGPGRLGWGALRALLLQQVLTAASMAAVPAFGLYVWETRLASSPLSAAPRSFVYWAVLAQLAVLLPWFHCVWVIAVAPVMRLLPLSSARLALALLGRGLLPVPIAFGAVHLIAGRYLMPPPTASSYLPLMCLTLLVTPFGLWLRRRPMVVVLLLLLCVGAPLGLLMRPDSWIRWLALPVPPLALCLTARLLHRVRPASDGAGFRAPGHAL